MDYAERERERDSRIILAGKYTRAYTYICMTLARDRQGVLYPRKSLKALSTRKQDRRRFLSSVRGA